jgi:hypothetical protein
MKKLAMLLVPIFLIGVFLTIYMVLRSGKPCTCYGIEIDNKCVGIRTMCFGLAPVIPLKGFKQENGVSEIIFNGYALKTGETFNFSPSEHCVGDMKARLAVIYDNSISIDVLEEQRLNGNYYAVKSPKKLTIKNGECVFAIPLCMDVAYKYCFSVDSSVKPNIYSYEIKGESTMPLPVEK